MTHLLDEPFPMMDGETTTLRDLGGERWLVVNVASACGATPQYAGLQELHEMHDDLTVVGFPCNQFGRQEPGSDADIKEFCSSRYDVSFPMFSKIDVNGGDAAPIYKFLTSQDTTPAGKGDISWNFEKFLIDREGQLVGRYSPRTKPSDADLVKAVESELGK